MNINSKLQQDFDTLAQYLPGDKFAVEKGVLKITRAGFLQAPTRTVKNLIQGGYNRKAVASHLGNLVMQTTSLINNLNVQNSYDECKQLRKRLKEVKSTISNIEYAYRASNGFDKDRTTIRLSNLFDQFYSLHKHLKEELKEYKPVEIKKINSTVPVNLERVKIRMSAGESVEQVLECAKSVEKRLVPTWKKIIIVALIVLPSIIAIVPLQCLSPLKWVLWNPVEFLVKGEVTTESPYSWYIKNMFHIWDKYVSSSTTKFALKKYAMQVLSDKVITEKHIEAFNYLSKYVTELSLYLLVDSSTQSESTKSRSLITSKDFNALLEIAVENKNIKEISLPYSFRKTEAYLLEHGFKKTSALTYKRK